MDLSICRGNSRDLVITIEDPARTQIDVTGWTGEFSLGSNVIGEVPFLHLSSEDPEEIEVAEPAATQITVHLTEEETDLEPGWYVWDVRMSDPDGKDFTPLRGYLRILAVTTLPG